jgi:hypothetical protein
VAPKEWVDNYCLRRSLISRCLPRHMLARVRLGRMHKLLLRHKVGLGSRVGSLYAQSWSDVH